MRACGWVLVKIVCPPPLPAATRTQHSERRDASGGCVGAHGVQCAAPQTRKAQTSQVGCETRLRPCGRRPGRLCAPCRLRARWCKYLMEQQAKYLYQRDSDIVAHRAFFSLFRWHQIQPAGENTAVHLLGDHLGMRWLTLSPRRPAQCLVLALHWAQVWRTAVGRSTYTQEQHRAP